MEKYKIVYILRSYLRMRPAVRNKQKFFIFSSAITFFSALLIWSNVASSPVSKSSQPIKIPVRNVYCNVSHLDKREFISNRPDLPMIYFITPTYPRPEQIPELTRVAHTLMLVPRLHWIVADDQPLCSDVVLQLLIKTGLPFTFIASPKPFIYKTPKYPRGVANRRIAIEWILKNNFAGVLYFGDDDNTVDLELFNEIRHTKKVSMFPVGLIAEYGVSSPIVKNGKVIGFFDPWLGGREFAVDMAGFAVNIKFLKPNSTMPYVEGHEEDGFLASLGLTLEDIEPVADNCTKILVWHTKAQKRKIPKLRSNLSYFKKKPHNFAALLNEVTKQGLAEVSPSEGQKLYYRKHRHSYSIESL